MTEEVIETPPPAEGQVSEPAETEEAAPSTDETEPPKTEEAKKPNGIQKRFDDLSRRRYEAEQRATLAETELDKLRKDQVKGTHESNKPTLDEFDHDTDQYTKAMENWAEQGLVTQRAELEKDLTAQASQQQANETQRLVNDKLSKIVEKHPDFHEVLRSPNVANLNEVNTAAFQAMVDSEYMGEIAYYLAKNPGEIYSFQSLSPNQAVRKIIELESKFNLPVQKSNAPPPPENIAGSSSINTVASDKDSTAVWMEKRNKRLGR